MTPSPSPRLQTSYLNGPLNRLLLTSSPCVDKSTDSSLRKLYSHTPMNTNRMEKRSLDLWRKLSVDCVICFPPCDKISRVCEPRTHLQDILLPASLMDRTERPRIVLYDWECCRVLPEKRQDFAKGPPTRVSESVFTKQWRTDVLLYIYQIINFAHNIA